MWNELCDDQHDAHAMRSVNRLVLLIVVSFMSFGSYAIVTRFDAGAPPASITYGTQAPTKHEVVFGD